MHFSSSAIGIATAVALVSTNVVEGCPFASSGSQYVPKNHPIVPKFHRRVQAEDNDVDFGSMFGPDGRLVGSPSLDNGAFDAPGLLTPMREDGSTIADIVAGLSAAGGNGDMCLIRFQQLPPPAAGNFSFDQNAADLLAFKVYGDMMVDRFYQLSGPDVNEGGIIFSFCTSGSGGVESLCNAGIEPERLCDERLMKNSVRWPQAITGFKLTNMTLEAVKAAIATWRTTDGGHLPSIVWSFNGGSPDLGGSQIGIWGNIGGLNSKIVRCDDIPEKFMYFQYPNGTAATSDFIDPETNETISEMLYQWWTAYGGYNEDGEQVFGEGPTSPGTPCAYCFEAAPCFDSNGCSSFDFESQTWAAPYDACNAAIGCKGCFDECTAPATDACAPCAEAAPCFDSNGCSSFDSESQTWAAPYDACNPAIECKGCFDECTAPATPTMAPVAPTVAPVTATTSPPADSGVGTSALTVTAISVVMMVAAFAF